MVGLYILAGRIQHADNLMTALGLERSEWTKLQNARQLHGVAEALIIIEIDTAKRCPEYFEIMALIDHRGERFRSLEVSLDFVLRVDRHGDRLPPDPTKSRFTFPRDES